MAHQETNDLTREDFDAGPSSYNEIEPNLYLGNLTAATDVEWLKQAQITYILTVDSCPLPRKIQCLPDVTLKYIQVTDMPREDLLTYFEDTYQFILYALERGGKVLVHCYFGVSRSATLIIAYMMKKYNMSFSKAFEAVKQKRRFVGPNPGFIAQLKLYEHMDFSINNNNIQFKLYRLQVAADNVRKAKILPQNHMDLIRSDPGLATVRPEPTVYRCKKCRRIVANASNILPHAPKEQQIWRHVSTKRHDKPPKQIKCLQMPESATQEEQKTAEICMKTYFIEPLAWMPEITHNVEGKLNCPKCNSKLGAFSWISGCQCPCGSKIAPAFYLVPSKVDWSNVVQNVESTI